MFQEKGKSDNGEGVSGGLCFMVRDHRRHFKKRWRLVISSIFQLDLERGTKICSLETNWVPEKLSIQC